MANRYWVGGAGTWNATNIANWSATSGGAGGASAPTTADDVFFNANSNGASAFSVTISTGAAAKSIDCTGFTRTITGTGAITVAGSVTLVAGMTYTHTGTMTFSGTGTLTTAGKTFSAVTVNGAGITLTLGSALTTGGAINVTQGTFATSNYNVTATNIVSSNLNVRAITLGSSTITLLSQSGWNTSTTTNLTLNFGTSSIVLQNSLATFSGGGLVFYNVSFTDTSAGVRYITGANTFNNLTLSASAASLSTLLFLADQTINGTFTCAGSSALQRGFVGSGTLGFARTITAAAISADDCDFRDITIAGAASPISPTRAGDCGGNSGITFPAAKTVYRVGTNTNWAGSSSWATTSGGAGSNVNFPLAQDTAVINEDTALTGTLSLGSTYNIGTVDASARTTGITLDHNAVANCYGSYTLGSGVTVSGTSAQNFSGRGTMVFTSAGKSITFPITVQAPGGTFQLGDAFNSSNSITLTRDAFDANNYSVTATRFTSNGTITRTINMGSGLWTLSAAGTTAGAAPWNTSTTENLTFNKGTADILLSDNTTTARTFFGGALSFNKLTIGGATSTSLTNISGASSFTELASTKTVAHIVRVATDLGTIGTWSITGSAGNVVTVDSSTAGTRCTLNLTNVTSGINYLSVKDIGINQVNRFYVGANSTDGGNNSNVYFTAAPVGAQTLSPTLYTNSNIFYAQVLTGYYALAPPLYTNTNTFFAAAVTRALTPTRYDNTNAFYTPTVGRGAVNLTPTRYDNTNAFYAAAISSTVALQASRYDNTNAFYAASISVGSPTLLPELLVNINAFYATAISARVTLQPSCYNNTNAFYAAAITSSVALQPIRCDNTNAFYAATVIQVGSTQTLVPLRYNNANTLYGYTITSGQITLLPIVISNTNLFYSGSVVPQNTSLLSPYVVNSNSVYNVIIKITAVDKTVPALRVIQILPSSRETYLYRSYRSIRIMKNIREVVVRKPR